MKTVCSLPYEALLSIQCTELRRSLCARLPIAPVYRWRGRPSLPLVMVLGRHNLVTTRSPRPNRSKGHPYVVSVTGLSMKLSTMRVMLLRKQRRLSRLSAEDPRPEWTDVQHLTSTVAVFCAKGTKQAHRSLRCSANVFRRKAICNVQGTRIGRISRHAVLGVAGIRTDRDAQNPRLEDAFTKVVRSTR
jgi:hypothetical protein